MYTVKNIDQREMLLNEADAAMNRMKNAENMLDHTCERELIESAILEMESARKKYNYLLKKIKENSVGAL